jgi:thiol peroxidase
MERENAVTMKGNPLTLVGEPIKVGQKAPNFTVAGNDLSPVQLSQFLGKTVVISSVPSLDTPVCDIETRRFNAEAAKLDKNVVILTISMDLPFAQKRWCGAAGIDHVTTLSDYQQADFGMKYGLLIKGLRLLARAVLVVDKNGTIQYIQLVPEIAQEPDYAAVLKAVENASSY